MHVHNFMYANEFFISDAFLKKHNNGFNFALTQSQQRKTEKGRQDPDFLEL